MRFSGVQGVGIGEPPPNRPDSECAVIVYTAGKAIPPGLPHSLTVTVAGGGTLEVPVVVKSIGVIGPE